jgi:hypothetical protein
MIFVDAIDLGYMSKKPTDNLSLTDLLREQLHIIDLDEENKLFHLCYKNRIFIGLMLALYGGLTPHEMVNLT